MSRFLNVLPIARQRRLIVRMLLVAGYIDGQLIVDHVCAADDCCCLASYSLFFILGFDRTFEGDLAMSCNDFYVVCIMRQGFVRDDRLTNSCVMAMSE